MTNGVVGLTFRGLAQAFMRSAAAVNATATDTIAQLRLGGLGYRYQDFLNDYAQYSLAVYNHDALRHVPDQYRPSIDSYSINSYGQPSTPFTYVAEVTRTSKQTGNQEVVYRNITSDTQLSAGDIKSDAWDMMSDEGLYPEYSVDDVQLYEAWATPDAFVNEGELE